MTDDELVAATDLAIHDALRDQETKFAAGKAALAVAVPEIRRQVIEEMRAWVDNEHDECTPYAGSAFGLVNLDKQRKSRHDTLDAFLDTFAKEHGDDR